MAVVWWGSASLGIAQTDSSADKRTEQAAVDFATDIAPILEANCLRCHSQNLAKGEIGLATAADLRDGGYVVAGAPDASYLLDLVTTTDETPAEMPADGEPLSAEDVALLRQWIEQGATWPDDVRLEEKSQVDSSWWAFQPLRIEPTQAAESMRSTEVARVIDAAIAKKLDSLGLARNDRADRRTLIRRAAYDLHGLPPTPAEVRQFVDDKNEDAYPRLIERLLASPRYGERWGRHWLDVVRFGESRGFERNVLVDTLWPFRDYVIRSLNDDKSFDQFIHEHLAGDVLDKNDPDLAIGAAFLVAGPYDDVGNQDAAQAAQIRANTLDEIIRSSSQAFLGLTIGCARCHYHKFDPISQQDYYSLYATFSGVRHGNSTLATQADRDRRRKQLEPLQSEKQTLQNELSALESKILERGRDRLDEYRAQWIRPPVDRAGTEEEFEPVEARYVRFICEARDDDPSSNSNFSIDEFEVWTVADPDQGNGGFNAALAQLGASASGATRRIEDFPDAYGPHRLIDGLFNESFLAASDRFTIDLGQSRRIHRIVFSSARGQQQTENGRFRLAAEYRIEASVDGMQWDEISNGRDRQPVNETSHLTYRLKRDEPTVAEREQMQQLTRSIGAVQAKISAVPELPQAWIGTRHQEQAQGPFQIFLGGSPQRLGDPVRLTSLSALDSVAPTYELPAESSEGQRRLAFANWLTDAANPLPPRVLANRVWQYHFGTGIVATPSDFGAMGSPPSHPELLDFLAQVLQANAWKLKPLHRAIMLSETYQQASTYREVAGRVDADARLLWRFPPRRLSAEEIRDTVLSVAGCLDTRMGGPGFRLYHFMQDNVCTYDPLSEHGPETYRRAVYHQNARSSVVDLMTDFDQPDCAFSTPRRSSTTTPLQALTMLNHSFTLDMANRLSKRIMGVADNEPQELVKTAYQLCYAREPTAEESQDCEQMMEQHGLVALCRVLLNTSELIYVE